MNQIAADIAQFPRNARWIGDRNRPTEGEPPCPYLRKSFFVDGEIQRAVLTWTALGAAEPYLNGKKIGCEFLAPGWTDYRRRTQVITTDVTDCLHPGNNMLGAILGDGWYCGDLLGAHRRNHYGKHPQFLAHLEIEMQDGRHLSVTTDSSWKMRYGALLASGIYHGETYDARREPDDWCSADSAQRSWKPVHVFPAYTGILQHKLNEPMRITETIPTRRITSPKPGVYIFDFGQNLTGFCRLKISGVRGQKITLKFGEMLHTDGSIYRENLRGARCVDVYICRGGGVEEWEPHFTFHGFRYVEVTGLAHQPEASLLAARVLHSDLRPTGSFSCSNKLLNRLHANTRWGWRGNSLDIPMDCPQRDERLGWTGDAQVFIGAAAFHYDVRRFFRKWLQDLRDGQRKDGAYPDTAPSIPRHEPPRSFGNAAWADAGVICPWKIYWHYGDKEILAENYDAMMRWIEYQRKTSHQLIRPRTSYGDWLCIDTAHLNFSPVPSELIGTAYFAHTTELVTRISRVLGHQENARRFEALHKDIVSAFQNTFVTPAGRIAGYCQTAYLLALAFDLLPARLRPKSFALLLELIEMRDFHLTTGFVGTPLLLPVLSRFGRSDVARKILLQKDYPSWLYSVINGATTIWERWNGYTHENGFAPASMNSFNHYALGAVEEWMTAYLGGIRPLSPGYKKFLIAPEPGEGVTSANTELLSPVGKIACRWKIRGERLMIDVEVPNDGRGSLKIPAAFHSVQPVAGILPPGRHRIEALANSPTKQNG